MVFSQGSSSSGNVGFPDLSRKKTIIFNTDNWNTRAEYSTWPNLTFVSGKPYVIPEDGWIFSFLSQKYYDHDQPAYTIYWYVNNIELEDIYRPLPVKKGDVIKIYNTYYKECSDSAMIYAPNRK